MTTQHTPGPWDIFPKDDTLEIGNYGENAPLVRLSATVPTNDMEGWGNARLIASAPDLLSALEDARIALRFYKNWMAKRTEGRTDYPYGIQAEENARAAIAKAKGGAA